MKQSIRAYRHVAMHTYASFAVVAEKWRGVADMQLNTDFRGRQADLEHEFQCLLAKSRVRAPPLKPCTFFDLFIFNTIYVSIEQRFTTFL
jgi:hypothetical protein